MGAWLLSGEDVRGIGIAEDFVAESRVTIYLFLAFANLRLWGVSAIDWIGVVELRFKASNCFLIKFPI